MGSTARTPQQSPARRVPGITQTQKQALIDNLQLEITERARKLRAQHALQAQGLRARLELRVNRIPQALRKRNIQEVIDEHHVKSRPAPPPSVAAQAKVHAQQASQPFSRTTQPAKRKSDEISAANDQENLPGDAGLDIANPKKRTKTTVAANSKATRARNAGPAGVLSPRSHNSRTLPQSPVKQSEKPAITRPMSAAAHVTTKATRAPSRQTKRPATACDVEGRTSEASNTSAGTTIVTKSGARKAAPSKKAPTTVKGTGTSRKPAATKAEIAPLAAATRTLRKRN